MENPILETVTISSIDNAFYDIKIKDFHSATEPFEKFLLFVHTDESFEYLFRAEIIPNLVENTECWLAFNPQFAIHLDRINDRQGQYLCGTLSIVDVEGNSRFPLCVQNFQARFLSRPTDATKYLKKSFILRRGEEFLPDGVLTLRVDFIFDSRYFDVLEKDDRTSHLKSEFLYSGLRCPRRKNKDTTKTQNDNFTELLNFDLRVYDLTNKIIKLPQFHEARRRFGVYGIPPEKTLVSSELEEVNPEIFEHVWMFDVKDEFQSLFHRFLLSLDEREDSVGTKLLKASPVLRRMVNAPMREQGEKRIELADIRSFLTLFYTLTFLDRGKFGTKDLDDLVGVYQFSHLYGMEELQRKCAESMAENSEHESEFEELERIAEHYQDKYLALVLKSRRDEYGSLTQTLFGTDDVPCSDCYI